MYIYLATLQIPYLPSVSYLLIEVFSISDVTELNVLGIMNWKGCGRKLSLHNVKLYSGICRMELNKTTQIFSLDSFPNDICTLDGPPDYKVLALFTRSLPSEASFLM
jgi:hypothetical protein